MGREVVHPMAASEVLGFVEVDENRKVTGSASDESSEVD